MNKPNHARMSDHEFIRAARIEQRECELAHNVAWKVVLGIDNLRSVISIRMEAREVAGDGSDEQLASYEVTWPNSYVQTFPACLFQAAVRLTRLVEDSRRDELMPKRERLAAR